MYCSVRCTCGHATGAENGWRNIICVGYEYILLSFVRASKAFVYTHSCPEIVWFDIRLIECKGRHSQTHSRSLIIVGFVWASVRDHLVDRSFSRAVQYSQIETMVSKYDRYSVVFKCFINFESISIHSLFNYNWRRTAWIVRFCFVYKISDVHNLPFVLSVDHACIDCRPRARSHRRGKQQ